MITLIIGLVLFFGIHSISIVALPLRDRLAARNELGWKLVYGLISLAGLILLASGYSEYRHSAPLLYLTPVWMRHVAALLLLPVFILFLAPYFPGRIKRAMKNPQLVSVKLWAIAHLLVNGTLADLMLFGSFLVWAIAEMISMSKRTVRAVPCAAENRANDIILILAGLGIYLAFTFWLHGRLMGVTPFA